MLCKATPSPVLTGFGPGTLIETTEGPVPVEWLALDHQLITRSGLEPMGALRRISVGRCAGHLVSLDPATLDGDCDYDEFPLLVSARQRLLLRGDDIGLHFGHEAVLAEAGHLLPHPGVSDGAAETDTPIFELSLRPGAVVRANGIWIEATHAEAQGGTAAYPCLNERECHLILKIRGEFTGAGRGRYQSVA